MLQSTLLILLSAATVVPPSAGASAVPDGVRLVGQADATPVRAAVRRAARRLARPACRAVLGDFTDARGRTLQHNLDALGFGPAEYVRSILFYGGFDDSPCRRRRRLLAFTAPGSRVVRLCRPLVALSRSDPERAALWILHETLHTLGLGEDPPSGREITARVRARCFAAP